ncbi:MAG: class I SAM-dependent methyltransferase [Thermoguttaceae bacterium]|nr:class I SAM-dependent methyltransferase [Thermoguttaceae bacterium]
MGSEVDNAAKTFTLPPKIYDDLINWERRLAKEGPFFRHLFEEYQVRRVLDAACGTGRHAQLFHSWGLEVEGADVNAEMIELARQQFGTPPGLRWVLWNFLEPYPTPGNFDAAVCLGNSLSLAKDGDEVCCALANLLGAVRPGGIVLVHVLNYARVPIGKWVWQKVARCQLEGRQVLALKGIYRLGDHALMSFIFVDPVEPEVLGSYVDVLFCQVLKAVGEFLSTQPPAEAYLFLDYVPSSRLPLEPGTRGQFSASTDILIFIRK